MGPTPATLSAAIPVNHPPLRSARPLRLVPDRRLDAGSPLEAQLIAHPSLARLATIHQKTSWLQPHGLGRHSRLDHSRGSSWWAERFAAAVHPSLREAVTGTPAAGTVTELLRVALLLHDLTHAPFSHQAEELVPGFAHEDHLVDAIAGPLGTLLRRHGIDPLEVAWLVAPERSAGALGEYRPPVWLRPLSAVVRGPINADGADWVLRDWAALGRTGWGSLACAMARIVDTARIVSGVHGVQVALSAERAEDISTVLRARLAIYSEHDLSLDQRRHDIALLEIVGGHLRALVSSGGHVDRSRLLALDDRTVLEGVSGDAGETVSRIRGRAAEWEGLAEQRATRLRTADPEGAAIVGLARAIDNDIRRAMSAIAGPGNATLDGGDLPVRVDVYRIRPLAGPPASDLPVPLYTLDSAGNPTATGRAVARAESALRSEMARLRTRDTQVCVLVDGHRLRRPGAARAEPDGPHRDELLRQLRHAAAAALDRFTVSQPQFGTGLGEGATATP